MRITHVIRGDDHVNNAAPDQHVPCAGAPLPVFGHTPTVLGADGEKLSKRHGAVSLVQYAEDGYLPETMLNFLARLGWSHGDTEVFSREELTSWFDLGGISASPARFNGEKLAWLNGEHIKRTDAARLGALLEPFLIADGSDPRTGPSPASIADLYRERAATLVEMAHAVRYFYRAPEVPGALQDQHLSEASRALLHKLAERLAAIDWMREAILATIKAFATEQGGSARS